MWNEFHDYLTAACLPLNVVEKSDYIMSSVPTQDERE
jgi:hypothetical protein